MTTHDTPIAARVRAELAVYQGDLAEAVLLLERALVTAAPQDRAELEQALAWLEDLLPVARPSWPPVVGEA